MIKQGLPLQPTLVSVVVALIVAGAGGVGVLAYSSSNVVVDDLWRRLSAEMAVTTTQRTLRYLEPAVPFTETTRRLAAAGRVDPSEPLEMLDYFHAGIEANPNFTWVSHGSEDGTYLAVYRTEEGNVRGAWRTQLVEDSEGHAATLRVLERREGTWQVLSQERGQYDPRQRPWYRTALEADGGSWVEPFLFATVQKPGFMYVAKDEVDGRVRGVWAVEYEVSYLSDFLSTMEIGQSGRVYVVTRTGKVVGHPAGQVTAEENGDLVIASALRHPDPMLAGAWQELSARGVRAQSFGFAQNLAMVEPFPPASGIDWVVLVVAPEEDFFGTVRAQAWTTVGIASLAALLAVLAGVFFSSRVSGALRSIASEMGRVGRFELSDDRFGSQLSFVREINVMREATDNMKKSLRSFGKYVPRDLVRDLIKSGQEAVLGGRKERLTILFADVVGFTSTAETMDPSDLVPVLGDCLESVSETVRDHRGTVDKYIGDAIMAFWGAPRPIDDHATCACRAALEIGERLEALRKQWDDEGKPCFSMRVGLNTGDAVVGNIGAPNRMNYTVIGDAVNLASRLESLNRSYGTTILVGETTAKAVEDSFLLRPVDWVAVKGKRKSVLIYELLSETGPAEVHEAIDVYANALELYRGRQFEEAAAQFDNARELFGGNDEPSEIMAARARSYQESPPDEDWDGTFVVEQKG